MLLKWFIFYYLRLRVDYTIMNTEHFWEALEDGRSAFHSLGLPFFIIDGTALGFHRDGTFIPYDNDIDVGTMYTDIIKISSFDFCLAMSRHNFILKHDYGTTDHGKVLTFSHKERVPFDIYFFYREEDYYYAATYGDICDLKKYGKCRFKYSLASLNCEQIILRGKDYQIVPMTYIKEMYGPTWNIPLRQDYHERLVSGYFNMIDE
uniref:LicD/FKTN/FKRP nucleotidyltransferase domain-containing protein n=1 Tax=viral metagenome TaxID=1070528 RepID=A0A6C0KX62_9ZZZZ